MAQVEVITGTARRRTYTEEQKLALLAAAFSPGVCVRDVIRRHDIPASSLYKWRQQYGVALPRHNTAPSVTDGTSSAFAQVVAAPELGQGVIEIEVGPRRLRMPGSITPALATAIVSALVRP